MCSTLSWIKKDHDGNDHNDGINFSPDSGRHPLHHLEEHPPKGCNSRGSHRARSSCSSPSTHGHSYTSGRSLSVLAHKNFFYSTKSQHDIAWERITWSESDLKNYVTLRLWVQSFMGAILKQLPTCWLLFSAMNAANFKVDQTWSSQYCIVQCVLW